MTSRSMPEGDRLILVSNRGPVTHEREDGERVTTPGGGGLVTALAGLTEHRPVVWISAAISDEDVAVQEEAGDGSFAIDSLGVDTRGRFVVMDPQVYEQYYNVIANPMLWFIQHYLWDLSNVPDIRRQEVEAWEDGYLVANEAFADAVVREIDRQTDPVVLLHDYHLYTAPASIRRRHPDAFLHFFIHIPWAQPDYWCVLPPEMRRDIIGGLLANDIVAFHTHRYARNFLLCCQDLMGLRVDYERMCVEWEGREVWARSYPISINAKGLVDFAAGEEVADEEGPILRRRRSHLIVRVDRTDLSKNAIRGFKAFDVFLDEHPEYREEITFLALLQPSRQDVPEYVEFTQKILEVVSHINTKHGNTDWMPIDLRIEQNLARAFAAFKHYDVLMVNAIYDGMNLVAKEGPLVNERDGVMILSENTGAHEELGSFAITVNPFDVRAQAEAIHMALTMPPDERAGRLEAVRRIVHENDVGKWLDHQLSDIARKRDGAHA